MHSSRLRQCLITVCVLAATLLTACAGNIPAAPRDQRAEYDPWEPLNRRIYNFNRGFDKVTFKPLAKGYQWIMPEFAERGIHNASVNLLGPLFIINNLLQGKPRRAGKEFGRLLINTVFGLGGLIDAASTVGIESSPETFGQTFAVWGISDGPFVVVPILGPRVLSSAVAIPLNFAADPTFYMDDSTEKWAIYGIRAIDARMQLFAAEEQLEDAYDPYLRVREAYLQFRRYQIYDGNPPEDEDFYDDFLEEEEK
ncbi:MAG: VacJ family lipoprotein [Woeseiaceae bacterium]|nr:VacJ family lipoprotein [Woeseiaceae bacterium]